MDSRLIFAASEKIKPQVSWVIHSETEWVYFGAGDEVNLDFVKEIVDNRFSDTLLRISLTRQGSFESHINDFLATTKNILGHRNFIVWNSSFDQAIEFNTIGVLRYGTVSG